MTIFKPALLAFLALYLGFSTLARADWEITQGTDPMTDDKNAYISVDNEEGTYALALKCWNDKGKSRWFAFITSIDFDKAQKYPESTQISLRIDQERALDMTFGQVNMGNKLSYVTGPDFGKDYVALEKKILNARGKIVASFMANMMVFNVPNSREAIAELKTHCPYLGK
jgi:hypothetical protein